MELVKCPKCGRPRALGHRCPSCGDPAPPAAGGGPAAAASTSVKKLAGPLILVCQRCGATLTKEVDFCPNCGALAPGKDQAPSDTARPQMAGPALEEAPREQGWWAARTPAQLAGMALAVAVLIAVVVAAVVVSRGDEDFDPAKLSPAYDAYLAVEAAVDAGPTYQDYGNLVEYFASQVDVLLAGGLSDQEERAAESLQGALQAHQRGLETWRESIETGAALDEEALQIAWAQAHIQAEEAVELMAAATEAAAQSAGSAEGASGQTERPGGPAPAVDAQARTLLRNALTAVQTAYAETQDLSAITLADLASIEPSIDWVAARPGVYAEPPTDATAAANAVGWAAAGAHTCELGTWSESGAALGFKVDTTRSPGTSFYVDGAASAW